MQPFAQLTVWRSQEPQGRYDGQRQLSVRLSCCTHLGVTLSQFSTCLLWLGWHCADNQPGLSLLTCFRASEGLEPAILHHRGFFISGTDCSAEAASVSLSSCLGCAGQPVSHSHAEPLNLSHHSSEGGCSTGAVCSVPTAPVDGKIAGK